MKERLLIIIIANQDSNILRNREVLVTLNIFFSCIGLVVLKMIHYTCIQQDVTILFTQMTYSMGISLGRTAEPRLKYMNPASPEPDTQSSKSWSQSSR